MYCSKCGKPLQAGRNSAPLRRKAGGSLPGAHAAREVPQASRRPFIHRGGPGSFDFSDFVECVWPGVLFRWLRHHRDWLEPFPWAFGRRDSAGRYLPCQGRALWQPAAAACSAGRAGGHSGRGPSLLRLSQWSGSGSSSDVPSSDFAQNPYESCHSTQEHIQAISSYDLNHDNYLPESELELFAEAHPRFINDEPFLAWAENHLG